MKIIYIASGAANMYCGSGMHANALAAVLKAAGEKDNGLEHSIKLLDTLERREKLSFFKQIDMFSVPAPYREPRGISILQALASGVPVVQPEHGAYPEWIRETGGGLLHRPNDPVDLAEKLAVLLRDPDLRKQLGQQGRHRIFDKHGLWHAGCLPRLDDSKLRIIKTSS